MTRKPKPRTRAERMGRTGPRMAQVMVRLSATEQDALEKAAAADDLPLATWLRRVALSWVERGKISYMDGIKPSEPRAR